MYRQGLFVCQTPMKTEHQRLCQGRAAAYEVVSLAVNDHGFARAELCVHMALAFKHEALQTQRHSAYKPCSPHLSMQTMGLHTWGIYRSGSADRQSFLGQVRKASSTRADITLEKTPQSSYTAEGNLADMTYTIKTGNGVAAQVRYRGHDA